MTAPARLTSEQLAAIATEKYSPNHVINRLLAHIAALDAEIAALRIELESLWRSGERQEKLVTELQAKLKVEPSVNRLVRIICERIAAGDHVSLVMKDYGLDKDAMDPLIKWLLIERPPIRKLLQP